MRSPPMAEYQQFLLETIRRGAEELPGLARFFPPDRLRWKPRPASWSAMQHLHHLRLVEQRYLERLEGVLAHGEYVPAPTPKPGAEPEASESSKAIVADYLRAREREIAVLERLAPADWRRRFEHPTGWGEVSVEWWAERIVQHTADHLQGLWMLRQMTGLTPDARERFLDA